ncbi:D-isomer specific 2-hydroxyacid dehydrogenase [Pseudohyphozyma bogoriensis]|nr:D-isomer specific 2-hydroxyacid dehydrogenase [Pseudohyphozyma bogoriensis]
MSSNDLRTLLVYGPVPPTAIPALEAQFPVVHYFHASPIGPPPASLPTSEQYSEADVILLMKFPPNLTSLSQTPKLRLVQCISAGLDHLTLAPIWGELAANENVMVASAKGVGAVSIGEHCVAVALMLLHKLNVLGREKEWVNAMERFGGLFVREIRGMKVGIMGYGNIGRETARLSASHGATILALTRNGTKTSLDGSYIIPGTGDAAGTIPSHYYSSVDLASRQQFFEESDIVVNILPSLPENKGFVGERELRWMKSDAVLINVGRGDTVDTEALVKALEAGLGKNDVVQGELRIGGAGLDVTDPEPLPSSSPLWTLENVIVTPHSSGLTSQYMARIFEILATNVRALNGEGEPVNKV